MIPKRGRCPTCGRFVTLRADGSVGRHYASRRKGSLLVCEASPVESKRLGRRVRVSLDLVVPADWSNSKARLEADQILRTTVWDVLTVVAVTVEPDQRRDEAS